MQFYPISLSESRETIFVAGDTVELIRDVSHSIRDVDSDGLKYEV